MLRRFHNLYAQYPRQYWLMIVGLVISTAGGSMIWPFMLIYAGSKLDLPLSTLATLISINAASGLFTSFLAGAVADKFGRKLVMNISLTLHGLAFFFLMNAGTYAEFAVLMVLIGLSNPMYQVGADAMLADMIPSEKRTEAYAINRIAGNAAFALGPAAGGFLASRSYNLAFYLAAAGFLTYSLMLLILARETLVRRPAQVASALAPRGAKADSGYGRVFQDRRYLGFALLMSLGLIAPTLLWILMPIYAKVNFGIPENLYGWIPTTNALMCVFVQYSVTQLSRRHAALKAVAVGMLVYAIGAGSVALMTGFWGFWLSMVILTFGELLLVPTASKYVADLAPADLRGRYMSIYWLGWGVARTVAPIVGGFLNDNLTPRSIWIFGLALGISSSLGLLLLNQRGSNPEERPGSA
jgi:MFS family permease